MFTRCPGSVLPRRVSTFDTKRRRINPSPLLTRARCSQDVDQLTTLLQLAEDRFYVSPGQTNFELFTRGLRCSYGPLGTELKRNMLEQWWHSLTGSSAQVFGINTASTGVQQGDAGGGGQVRIVRSEMMEKVLKQALNKEQLIQEILLLLQRSPSARTNLLQGALEQFVPLFKLVNRKLPFGLAEVGQCFQPTDGSAEVTLASLVWFCSPRTATQWLDHWARQRLKWWRKFALSPSDFRSCDIPEGELEEMVTHGVRIVYSFPWGQETLETLCSRGDAELLQTHSGARSKVQCQDRHKTVPHVVSLTGNMDRGMMAILSNSLQLHRRDDSKRKLQQRKVLKLNPVLAPVKVALDISRGPTMELRQVCEGLLMEFKEAKISAWPGYLETMATSMEQPNAKYDEMGVLFTVVISEKTLESGLLQVRSRDTTIKETMHISEIKNFLCRYISAAGNM